MREKGRDNKTKKMEKERRIGKRDGKGIVIN